MRKANASAWGQSAPEAGIQGSYATGLNPMFIRIINPKSNFTNQWFIWDVCICHLQSKQL